MDIYEKRTVVGTEYAAMNRFLRPSSMFSLLQDAAESNSAACGAGMAELASRGILWMVVHMRADVLRLPAYGDEVIVSTWLGEENHRLYTRWYEIRFPSGETAVKASGIWVLVDAKTRALVRDPDVHMPAVSTGRESEPPRRLRVPELTRSASFTARYSQADINGHMNNACYLDAAEDMIPLDYLRTHVLRYAAADYLREVVPGETLTLRYGCEGGAWWFRGDTHEPCFRVKLIYE